VVDDEPDLLDAITAILQRDGYEVLTALSGAAAKDILVERDIDLLLSDLRMPGLDGPGTVRLGEG
jgi:DNA-binding response OmpR family regulator